MTAYNKKVLTVEEGNQWKQTGINSAELNGVKYTWMSSREKGARRGWIGDDGTLIER
jgi:hypothetical protein